MTTTCSWRQLCQAWTALKGVGRIFPSMRLVRGHRKLDCISAPSPVREAEARGSDSRLMITSWGH